MKALERGQRIKLTEVIDGSDFEVALAIQSSLSMDASCFGVGADGKLRQDAYMVFYNQRATPCGGVRMVEGSSGEIARFAFALDRIPAAVQRLVLTSAIDGSGSMGDIRSGHLGFLQRGTETARFAFSGKDFSQERAMLLAELYRKDGLWRLVLTGQGFNGGLSALLRHFGGTEAEPTASPTPQPPPAPTPPPVRLTKVTLEKQGQSSTVSLKKDSQSQPIHINLNWDQTTKKGGLFGLGQKSADLDLGCMYEMQDGDKGVIQALGNFFGSKTRSPYVYLDKDDRTGGAADGENLYILRPDLIRRLVVFAFIYEGTSNFGDVGGRLRIRDQEGNEVLMDLNNPDVQNLFCAICRITHRGDRIEITKEERYFPNHQPCDRHYGFGFNWQAGRK